MLEDMTIKKPVIMRGMTQKQWVVRGQLWSGEEIAGKGVPIIIMHGWGRSGAEWSRLGKRIAQVTGRMIYILDLPGFGGSSLPRVTTIEAYAELVKSWLDYINIKRVSLVGHSLGGRVGIVLAGTYPEQIEKLVLIDPAGVKPRSLRRKALKLGAKLLSWVPLAWRRHLSERVMDEDYRNSPTLRELYRAVVVRDLRIYLPKITVPTWVIWGEKDSLLPLTLTDLYKKLLPYPTVRVIWEAGHDPHLTHPEKLGRILEEIWT